MRARAEITDSSGSSRLWAHRERKPRRIRIGLAFAVALAGALSPGAARAYDEEEQAATYAVQNRVFQMKHELHAGVGGLPLNAFIKGLTFGGGYTYHFSDLWAWEVGQFVYSKGLETDLREELKNFETPTQPTRIDSVEYFGSTNVVFKPLYGKFAFLNRSVVHSELFLVVGGGFGKMKPASFRPAGDFGAGLRIHLGRHTSLRVDIRDYVFVDLDKKSLSQELWMALSIALTFGSDSK